MPGPRDPGSTGSTVTVRSRGPGESFVEAQPVSESVVRRLLDPDHRSHVSRIEKALRAAGWPSKTGRRSGEGEPGRHSREGADEIVRESAVPVLAARNEPTPPRSEMQRASSMTSRPMRSATSAGASTAPVGRRTGPTGSTRRANGRRNRSAPRIAYHAPATASGGGTRPMTHHGDRDDAHRRHRASPLPGGCVR